MFSTVRTQLTPAAQEIIAQIEIGTSLRIQSQELNWKRIDVMNVDAELANEIASDCHKTNALLEDLLESLAVQTREPVNVVRQLCNPDTDQTWRANKMRELGCVATVADVDNGAELAEAA